MQPKKSKTLFRETAAITGIPENIVSLLVNEFYANVRESLSQLKFPVVLLPGLGNFVIKPWALDKQITKFQDAGKKVKVRGPMREVVVQECNTKLAQLIQVKGIYEEEEKRKQSIKTTKKAL